MNNLNLESGKWLQISLIQEPVTPISHSVS